MFLSCARGYLSIAVNSFTPSFTSEYINEWAVTCDNGTIGLIGKMYGQPVPFRVLLRDSFSEISGESTRRTVYYQVIFGGMQRGRTETVMLYTPSELMYVSL